MNTLMISLPEEMSQWVEKAVQKGGFSSASDYFHQLVREAQANSESAERERKKAELVALLNEGLESETIVVTPEWWANFREELEQELVERGRAE